MAKVHRFRVVSEKRRAGANRYELARILVWPPRPPASISMGSGRHGRLGLSLWLGQSCFPERDNKAAGNDERAADEDGSIRTNVKEQQIRKLRDEEK